MLVWFNAKLYLRATGKGTSLLACLPLACLSGLMSVLLLNTSKGTSLLDLTPRFTCLILARGPACLLVWFNAKVHLLNTRKGTSLFVWFNARVHLRGLGKGTSLLACLSGLTPKFNGNGTSLFACQSDTWFNAKVHLLNTGNVTNLLACQSDTWFNAKLHLQRGQCVHLRQCYCA